MVSRLGLGTATWGTSTADDDAGLQLSTFVDAGGTLVDAAGSEAISLLGKLLGDPGLRSDIFLVVRSGTTADSDRPINTSRPALREAIDRILAHLGGTHVDLWMLDGWDARTPLDETLSSLSEIAHSGRAHYVGLSNLAGWQLALAATRAEGSPHHLTIAAVEYEYSLLQRDIEAEVLPACRELGIGLLPWAPLGRGVLTGKYRHGTPPDSRGASESHGPAVRAYLGDRHRRIVEGVGRAAEGLGVSPAEIALSWVRDRPGVVAPVIGARTIHHLRSALAGDSLTLPAEIRSALDELSAPAVGYPAG